MKNNTLKIFNNKLFLFFIPNLIIWYQLFYYYNQNIKLVISVQFYEVIIGCILFLLINTIIYFWLYIFLKDIKKIFLIMCIISIFFSFQLNLFSFIIFLLIIILLVVVLKYINNLNLDVVITFISFIVIPLFLLAFIPSIYNVIYINIKSDSFDYKINYKIDKDTNTPNIYWIHTDGMMNMNTLKKYLNGDNVKILEEYYDDNDYFYNDNAMLVAGHSTLRALPALFNPYYYDNYYKDYLTDLEKVYLGKKKNTDYIVNYFELSEKKWNNELFEVLKKKNYDTVAVADFNSYTSLNVDYYYDYFHYLGMNDKKAELRYFDKSYNSQLSLIMQHLHTHNTFLYQNNILYHPINNINFLNYKVIDYKDIILDNYPHTKYSTYWYNKAILKVIDKHKSSDNPIFMFLDYRLNHYSITYDSNGSFLTLENQNNLNSYYGNYYYSCLLLIDMLNFIKHNDKNAVIVIQGDHGIHSFEDEYIMKELDINRKELQEIRNSVMNAVYVPKEYRNGDEKVLENPLNISRYLVNNFVGKNYEYID